MRFITNGGIFEVMTYQPVVEGNKRGLTCQIYFHPDILAGDAPVGLIQACHAERLRNGEWELFLSSVAQDEVVSTSNWYIDAGGQQNPVFGMRVDYDKRRRYAIEEGAPGGSPGGNGAYGAYKADRLQPAFIDDRPTRSFSAMKIKHEFETAAICLSGPHAGRCLGAIRWGYEVDEHGAVNRMRPAASGQPSPNWIDAVDEWNNHKTVKIPYSPAA